MTSVAESEQPLAWIEALEEDAAALPRLVQESGGLALAAWRLASARRRAGGHSKAIPSKLDLGTAAMELAERVGWNDPMPTTDMLAYHCRLSGFVVV